MLCQPKFDVPVHQTPIHILTNQKIPRGDSTGILLGYHCIKLTLTFNPIQNSEHYDSLLRVTTPRRLNLFELAVFLRLAFMRVATRESRLAKLRCVALILISDRRRYCLSNGTSFLCLVFFLFFFLFMLLLLVPFLFFSTYDRFFSFLFSIPSFLNKTPIIFFLFSSYGCCSSIIFLLSSPSFSHYSKKCSKFSILAPHSLHPTSPWCLFLTFNLRQFALALYIITEDGLLSYISSSLIPFFSSSYIFKLDYYYYFFF